MLEKYHFKLRDDCLFDLDQYYELDSSNNQHTDRNLSREQRSQFCPTTADFLLCFPTTPANQTIRFPCPYRDAIVLEDGKLYPFFRHFRNFPQKYSATSLSFQLLLLGDVTRTAHGSHQITSFAFIR